MVRLKIPANTNTKPTITITPKDDDAVEKVENVTLTLSNPQATDSADGSVKADRVVIDVDKASGNITNDDKPTVTISANEVEEGNPATVTVKLDKVSVEDITVEIKTVAGGTATEGTGKDYVTQTKTVTIPAGQKSITTTINTIDDGEVESKTTPETINVTGTVESGTVTNTTPATATIKVTDNDKPTVSISGTTVEEGGTSTVTVKLDKPSNEDITVNVTTTNGTAGDGDYTKVTTPSNNARY